MLETPLLVITLGFQYADGTANAPPSSLDHAQSRYGHEEAPQASSLDASQSDEDSRMGLDA